MHPRLALCVKPSDSIEPTFGLAKCRAIAIIRVSNELSRATDMIRFGKHIRLTRVEVERFSVLGGVAPPDVKSLDDLRRYWLCVLHQGRTARTLVRERDLPVAGRL